MPDEYADIIAAATGPTRTRKGALKYQPPDAEWNLDRLNELQDFYSSTYGRPLPVTVKGQGTIHNKWGYDHRSSADLSVNPSSEQGQALITEMQRRNIPFLAFDKAIPGVATGPHIHVGRPSSRTSSKYNVGSQVKKTAQAIQDNYDDIIAAATGQQTPSTDYTDVVQAATLRKLSPTDFPKELLLPGEGSSNLADIRRLDEERQRESRDTGMGRLKTIDQPQLERVQAIQSQVTAERARKASIRASGTEAQLLAQRAQPSFAEEFSAKLQADADAQAERQKILDSLTTEDRQQLGQLTEQLRGHGSVGRGVDIGTQRIASGLMYKLAGLADLTVHDWANKTFPLGDYLRRQAGIGDIAIQDIEAELPPDTKQKVADFLTTTVGTLPEIYAATAVGGPVGGFAALGGLEAYGRKKPLVEVARETAKGATLGVVFKAAPGVESGAAQTFKQRLADTARSGLAIGTGTLAVEKAYGADDYQAFQSALTNMVFHAGGKASAEIGRFAQAAERVLKTPDAVPEPAVPLETQARLAAAEEANLKTAPSVPLPAERRTPERMKDADWLALSPEEQAKVRQEVALEMEPPPVERPVVAEQPSLPFAEPIARSPLAELMRQRAEAEPSVTEPVTKAPAPTEAGPVTEPASRPKGINLITGKEVDLAPGESGYVNVSEIAANIRRVRDDLTGKKERALSYILDLPGTGRALAIDFTIDRKGVAHPNIGPAEKGPRGELGPDVTGVEPLNVGMDTLLALKRFLLQTHPEIKRVEFTRAGSTGGKAGRKVKLPLVQRTGVERPTGYAFREAKAVDFEGVRSSLAQRGFEVRELTEPIPGFAVVKGGREVAKFANRDRAVALESLANYAGRAEGGEGGFVDLNEIRAGLAAGKLKIEEAIERLRDEFPGESEVSLRARLSPQPRDQEGKFAEGSPGSDRAQRDMLRREAVKYREEFKAIDRHLARREGLDIVNEDVATDYFRRLRRLTSTHQPERVEAIDRAEALFNQGKYGQATMLAESVFRGLPDKVNEYASADAALQLVNMGQETRGDMWTRTIAEVKRRLKETGGLSGGGSTFYDVNKYPKGGKPDHEKIAYILEPVVEALKSDIRLAIDQAKLRAEDYLAEVRRQVDRMLAGPDFSDWHGVNKSAARGILVDQLKREGFEVVKGGGPTIPSEPPQPSAPEPYIRQRSLPKTLARSGREPGTNLTYERQPNLPTEARVAERMRTEGAEAVEVWYRSAEPSAERTAAFIQLVDHHMAESVRLADTAPLAAQAARAHAIALTNLENERSTSIGQAEQMYSRINKYNPVGVAREIASLKAKGFSVPDKAVEQLTRAATEHQKLDKEVGRLERKVAEAEVAEGEAAPPQGGGSPTKPRRYTPRKAKDTLSISAAERAREQLSEAAKRRRAAKRAIANQLRQIEQQRTALGYWRRSMNITRGLMVSQLTTAMRNLQSQLARFSVERLTDAVELSLRKSVGLDSDLTYRNIWRNTARQFQRQAKPAKEILSAHPAEYARMFNAYAGGVEVPIPAPAARAIERVFQTVERGVEIANTVNRLQEFHIRSAEFLAEVDLHLRKEHNQTLEQYVSRHGIDAIPQDIVTKGVNKALEVTFADMPSKDGAGGRLLTAMIEVGNYLPPTMSPVAFPRFMYNNLKFLYQYNITGLADIAVSAARNRSIAKQVERTRANTELTERQRESKITELESRRANIARAVSRTLIGSSMLLLAYQFRKSDHAGEKWYELKFGDTTVDARPFGPFSTYLFIAEAIRRQREGTKQFTIDEVAQALGSSPLGAGVGTALIEKVYRQITDADWDGLQRTIKAEGGEWGRALLTPVRQVKDFIAAFDESQAVTRDTSTEPFLGPIKESIPYASTNFPPAQRATTAKPIKQEHPLAKQLTGWRIETPKTFLEKQLDELNFSPSEIRSNTGVGEIDALEKRIMGPMMDQLSTELEQDTEFRKMSKAQRGKILHDYLIDLRDEVRSLGEAERPELYEQLREKRMPRRDREFQKETETSPGLSKALKLGVPMSIPPMLPGEDDIAYRARLLQLGRQRRGRLDDALTTDFDGLTQTERRNRLHSAIYS